MEVAGKSIDTETSPRETETKLCESCDVESLKTSAKGICRECEEHMCSTCFKEHLKGKPCRHHTFLSFEEFSSLSLGIGSKDVTKCEKHDNEVIKFYCRSHDVVGCGDCIVLEHTSCKPEYIKDLAKTFIDGDMYKAIVKRVEDLEEKNKWCGSVNEESKGNLEEMNKTTLKNIRQFRVDINKCLDEAEAILMSKLQKLTQENSEAQTKIEQTLKSLSSDLEEVKQVFNTHLHLDNALFINSINCKSKLSDIEKMYENEIQGGFLTTFEFVRNKNTSWLLKSAEPLGNLKIETKSMKQMQFVVGVRVRRGPNWNYGCEDCGGLGTLVGFDKNGWANVQWDQGDVLSYRVGQETLYDLELI